MPEQQPDIYGRVTLSFKIPQKLKDRLYAKMYPAGEGFGEGTKVMKNLIENHYLSHKGCEENS